MANIEKADDKNPLHRISPKQLVFAAEYCSGGNVTKAAEEANISRATANKWLGRPEMVAALYELRAAAVRDVNLDLKDVAALVKVASMVDPIEIYDEDGEMKPMSEIPPHVRMCIESIKTTVRTHRGETIRTVNVEFMSKRAAAEWLGRHFGAFAPELFVHALKTGAGAEAKNLSDAELAGRLALRGGAG